MMRSLKRTEFQACWHVKCGMSLHPTGNIKLRVPHRPISHFTCQHGRNSVLFWRPHHFKGTLATTLARSDTACLFLMGISERESLPKQTMNHRRLESKHHRRNSGSDSGRTGKDFKIWRAESNPVWTQMVATSSTCYDVTFLTQ